MLYNKELIFEKEPYYYKTWTSSTPGYIIFLVDQSSSMNEVYHEKGNKAAFTAMSINRIINEIIICNMSGDKVIDRVFISLLGYGDKGGDSVYEIRSDYLRNFSENPLCTEKGKAKIADCNGGIIEIDIENPIFIEPVSNGFSPMGSALELARRLIMAWMSKKPYSSMPIIINISDGLAYNKDGTDEKTKVIQEANAIMSLLNSEGESPLIFNALIGAGYDKHLFCENENELNDERAKFLFKISSKLPESFKISGMKCELSMKSGSRGFISNVDIERFLHLFNFNGDYCYWFESQANRDRINCELNSIISKF